MTDTFYSATGKRKCAIARVRMKEGAGAVTVNKRSHDDYFGRDVLKKTVLKPLELTDKIGKFDILINVRGGGPTGQAEAIRHAVSRALVEYDDALKPTLKKAGLLTRDARIKERKKYGQPGARKRFQYSKR